MGGDRVEDEGLRQVPATDRDAIGLHRRPEARGIAEHEHIGLAGGPPPLGGFVTRNGR